MDESQRDESEMTQSGFAYIFMYVTAQLITTSWWLNQPLCKDISQIGNLPQGSG